jgi:hypothetical protein
MSPAGAIFRWTFFFNDFQFYPIIEEPGPVPDPQKALHGG